jgi:hypothetical protein
MKWFVALTLVVASISVLVGALQRANDIARCEGRLDRLHETAGF